MPRGVRARLIDNQLVPRDQSEEYSAERKVARENSGFSKNLRIFANVNES